MDRVQTNLAALRASGFPFTLNEKEAIAHFREAGQPTVEFYLKKNRWKLKGSKKTTFGDVDTFLAWYRAERGVVR